MTASNDNQEQEQWKPSSEEMYGLNRIGVLESLKDEIKWAKRRCWLVVLAIAVLGSFIGVFGYFWVPLLIRDTVDNLLENQLKRTTEATSSAEVAATVARNLAQRASDKMNDAIKKANLYKEEAKGFQTRAAELNQTFVVLRQQLEANTANLKEAGRKDREPIEFRLAGLEKHVTDLSDESVKKEAFTAYKTELNTKKTETEKEKTEFQNNSEYMVVVNYRVWAKSFSENIVRKLSEKGFRATASPMRTADEAKNVVNAPAFPTSEVVTIAYYWPEDAGKAGFVSSVVTEVLPGEYKTEMKQDVKVSDFLARQALDRQLGIDFSKRIDVFIDRRGFGYFQF